MYPVRSKRQIRRFSVFDFEWIPRSLTLRVAGRYDGSEYQSYKSVDAFLADILTRDHNGEWFFAHYGGKADVSFILSRVALNPRYHVSAIFAGSAAIKLTVKDLRTKCRWIFLDSFCLLRESLAKVAEKLGEKKTGPTDDMTEDEREEWYATVPLPELIEYNENDCRILYRAILEFENRMLALGGQLRITIASCALDLFLRKYLKSELPCNATVNRWAGEAYIASRVEVLQKRVSALKYYDINSSFPFSGTRPLPGRLHSIGSKIPDNPDAIYLVDATVTVPEMHIPPLPYRYDGRVFFPTGTWRGMFFSADIQCLYEAGGRIESHGDVILFEPFGDDLKNYFQDITALKQKATGFEREQYKLLDNGLYGKFAEKEDKQVVHVNPPLNIFERLTRCSQCGEADYLCGCDDGVPKRGKMLFPGVWVENRIQHIEHGHTVISMAITSYSRQILWRYMMQATECYYCDTDGFGVHPDDEYPTGDGLGELKLEKVCVEGQDYHGAHIAGGEFVQPKLYRLHTTDGKVIYKAKGFSLGSTEKERQQRFAEILAGKDVRIRHMSRIREMLAKGVIVPWEETRPKKVQESIEKRCFDKEGKSRPWTIDEIQKGDLK